MDDQRPADQLTATDLIEIYEMAVLNSWSDTLEGFIYLYMVIAGDCAVIGYHIADKKGWDANKGSLIGLFFGPLGLVLMHCLPLKK